MKLPDGIAPGSRPLRDPRLTAINFVSDAVNRTLDLKEIADNALDSVLAVMKVDAGAMYIWQDIDPDEYVRRERESWQDQPRFLAVTPL